jgi:hypothetical protein
MMSASRPRSVKRPQASDEAFQARFETVMKVKEAVEAAGVVFKTGEDGLVHGVSLRAS